MDVRGRDLAGPHQAQVVVVALGNAGDRAADPDAVAAHDDRRQPPARVEDLEVERLGVLAAQLEDVAHLDPACGLQALAAGRAGVAVTHLGGLDDAVWDEVTSGDQVEGVVAVGVAAGHPDRPRDNAGVDEEAHARCAGRAQRLRSHVALDQRRVCREVRLGERLDGGGLDLSPEPLLVHLAVTGDAQGK